MNMRNFERAKKTNLVGYKGVITMKIMEHIKSMLEINIEVNKKVKGDNEQCKEIIKYMNIEIEVYKKVQRYIEIMELTHEE